MMSLEMADYNVLAEHSVSGMYIYEHGRFTYVNRTFTNMLGYHSLDQAAPADWLSPESIDRFNTEAESSLINNKQSDRHLLQLYGKNGDIKSVEHVLTTVLKEDSRVIFGTIIDVTSEIEQRTKLEQSEKYYQSLFEHNTSGIYSFDLDGNFISANPAVTIITGYTAEELIRINFTDIVSPEDITKTMDHFNLVKTNRTSSEYETSIVDKYGKVKYLHVINIPIIIDQEAVGVYGIATDITDIKTKIAVIERMAFHDLSTNLPNRQYFKKHITDMIDKDFPFVVLILDLDDFKVTNDTLGHDIGDKLLEEVSTYLKEELHQHQAFIARLAGDEFGAVLPNFDIDRASSVANKILGGFVHPFQVEQFEIVVSASIGLSHYPSDGTTLGVLMKNADIALYAAKSSGKRTMRVFTQALSIETQKKYTLVRDLQKAIDSGHLFLEFQPRYNLEEKRFTSVEALVRWMHPDWGVIAPNEFIPIAEETGLIIKLGEWVLREACIQMRSICRSNQIKLSVNISVLQIMSEDIVHSIMAVLKKERFDPKYLELEITESLFASSEEVMINFIKQIKEYGVQIALDDFGTGYSSISYLQKYDIDTVKLDKSFVSLLIEDGKTRTILHALVNLVKELGLVVVAEGIETSKQLKSLNDLYCDEAQGYYFSRPVNVKLLESILI